MALLGRLSHRLPSPPFARMLRVVLYTMPAPWLYRCRPAGAEHQVVPVLFLPRFVALVHRSCKGSGTHVFASSVCLPRTRLLGQEVHHPGLGIYTPPYLTVRTHFHRGQLWSISLDPMAFIWFCRVVGLALTSFYCGRPRPPILSMHRSSR